MADNKIPVLTEVYKPKKSKKAEASKTDAPVQITPELIAQIAAEIKPALQTGAESTEVEALRAEVKQLKEALAKVSANTDSDNQSGASSSDLDALRAELASVREELAASNQRLTEQVSAVSSNDTNDLAQSLTTQIKPRLEAEITDFALEELRTEIKKAREDILASTASFVDKTKADLKTEMPQMYQKSIDLAQVDLTERFAKLKADTAVEVENTLAAVSESQQTVEATQKELITEHHAELSTTFDVLKSEVEGNLKAAITTELTAVQEKAMETHKAQLNEALAGFLQTQGEEAEKTLLQQMHDYQERLHADYQEKLTGQVADALEAIRARVEESTEEQIGIMHSQVGTIQQETFAKLRQDFNAEKDLVYTEAASEISTTFTEQMTEKSHQISEAFLAKVNGNLPEVQQVLQDNVQAILDSALPALESRLREELTEEIKQLLLKVKFVLPD